MAVKKTKQSSSDLNDEIREVEDKKSQALSAILPTLDLPEMNDTDHIEAEEELEEIRAEEQRELRRKQNDGREELEDDIDEDDDEDDDIDVDDEEDDGDLIPRSKVDKRFKALTAKIKELESQARLPAQDTSTLDSDQAKLDKMGLDELRKTLRDTRSKSILLAASDDPDEKAQVNDYVDLEMKIHQSINSFGIRFYNDQVDQMTPIVAAIDYDEDIYNPSQAKTDIKKIAEDIYQRYPKMQTLKSGMAQAYRLAIDHYKVLQDSGVNQTESKRVKRENAKLKRKTTLDTSKVKGNSRSSSRKLDLLRKKMKRSATDTDRKEFVKESPMFNIDSLLPDEFKS